MQGVGLPGQQQIQELFTQFSCERERDAFELCEGGSHGWPLGPVETIGQIFYLSLQQDTAIVDFRECFVVQNHPWLR